MRYRCNNSNSKDYPNYGGRGIKICDSWENFDIFVEDMGHRPEDTTIGRIDNNGNYCKENCRWESRSQQQQNTRRNVKVEGKYSISDISQASGLNYNTVELRLKRGRTIDEILTTPAGQRSKSTLKDFSCEIGSRHERLVVEDVFTRLASDGVTKLVWYKCKCDCGNTKDITRGNFEKTASCGCIKQEAARNRRKSESSVDFYSLEIFEDENLNKTFNRLTIVEVRTGKSEFGNFIKFAKCLCDCGVEVIKNYYNVVGDHVKSCGCKDKEDIAKRVSPKKGTCNVKDGDVFGEHTVITIFDKNNHKYAVCQKEDGDIVEIRTDQLLSKAKEPVIVGNIIEYNGKALTLSGWSKELGIPRSTLQKRVDKGLPWDKVFEVERHDGRTEDYANMIFEYNGEEATLKEWAENLNISYNTLKSRVSRGTLEPSELFAPESRKPGPKVGSKKAEGSGRKLENHDGEKYGKLTVLETYRIQKGEKGETRARCICDCGKETDVLFNNLRKPNGQKSCGCSKEIPHNKGKKTIKEEKRLLYKDKFLTFEKWAGESGVPLQTIKYRYKLGYRVERILQSEDTPNVFSPYQRGRIHPFFNLTGSRDVAVSSIILDSFEGFARGEMIKGTYLKIVELFSSSGKIYAACECHCTGFVFIELWKDIQKEDIPRSCGCFRETSKEFEFAEKRFVGEYSAWRNIKNNWHDVDVRWISSFPRFYKDMGPRPTDNHKFFRLDETKPFNKDNCAWITYEEVKERGLFLGNGRPKKI
jgi:hypothetical protein